MPNSYIMKEKTSKSGFSIHTDNYYVVVNVLKDKCIITTSKAIIASFIGVSRRTIYRMTFTDGVFRRKEYVIYHSPRAINRNGTL